MSLYDKRGVSAQKEEVHAAVKNLDAGLYPNAFCKIYADHLTGDAEYVNVMHADGAGTKSILAYLYWKETGDISVWRGIAQDAIVMNLDDLLCVGITDKILFNSTIDRNKMRIPGEVLKEIIEGSQQVFDMLSKYGVGIHYLGGETADVGDVVRTVAVNGTMAARWPKTKLITNDLIAEGDVVIGLSSFGVCNYEKEYNSGIGSNGLTSARHDGLDASYAQDFPESFEPMLGNDVRYLGKNKLSDLILIGSQEIPLGKLLLSPTRTFAPVVVAWLSEHFNDIHGLVHCSGGGQTKCLKYLPQNFTIIKNNLFTPPPIFNLLQQNSGVGLKEMYEVYNMGTRLECYCKPAAADALLSIAASFGVDAQVIGRVEAGSTKNLIIETATETLHYNYQQY